MGFAVALASDVAIAIGIPIAIAFPISSEVASCFSKTLLFHLLF